MGGFKSEYGKITILPGTESGWFFKKGGMMRDFLKYLRWRVKLFRLEAAIVFLTLEYRVLDFVYRLDLPVSGCWMI